MSKVVRTFQWQFVHFCNIICSYLSRHYQDDHHCVELSYSVAQASTLIKRFYGLLGPKLATPGGDKYPLPSQVYRLLGTKVDLIASPREIQVLLSRIDSICSELSKVLSSKKLGKGHASEIFGKLSFSAGQLFGRFGRMHLAPFKLRQYGKNGCSHLTAEIERAIAFWLYVLPRGPFRAVPPHSGTPFVITMSDGEGTGSVAAAIWSPLAPGGVHQPVGFNSTYHLQHFLRGQMVKMVKISSLSVTSTKSRPSSLQSVFVHGPTSFAVPFGYTSLTTMVLWPALSPDAQKTAL